MNQAQFIAWERSSRDTIDFKKTYAHMAGDVLAGLWLSQIVYWHLDNRLRVERNGEKWIAKGRDEWFDEICLTGRQIDRVGRILGNPLLSGDSHERPALIEVKTFKFGAARKLHVRLLWGNFLTVLEQVAEHGVSFLERPVLQVDTSPNGDLVNPQSVNYETGTTKSPFGDEHFTNRLSPLTETTTKITAETTTKSCAADAPPPAPAEPPAPPSKTSKTKSRGKGETPEETALINACVPAVAAACEIDLAVDGAWARCRKVVMAVLHAETPPTPERIQAEFGARDGYWYTQFWKGRDKGEPPDPHDIPNNWQRAMTWRAKTPAAPRPFPADRVRRGGGPAGTPPAHDPIAAFRARFAAAHGADPPAPSDVIEGKARIVNG